MQQTEETELFVECPVASVQKVVRGKWSMVILSFLRHKTLRFGALSRKMPMVTQANLTKELRMLESYGLIHREVYPQVPPKVEYSLSPYGESLNNILDNLCSWGEDHVRNLKAQGEEVCILEEDELKA